MNYTYDGDGNRVQKSNGKIYWYGAGTEILDESDLSGNLTDEYIFFGGERVAHRTVSSGSISYYAEDFLGTSRVITTSTGSVCYEADFYPYGGERTITNTCPQNYKFEGKERDAETGNDDFGARYYSSSLGRWLSPDWSSIPAPVPYANLTNPQTLNLYAMVRDNPETFADLDGHDDQGGGGDASAGDSSGGNTAQDGPDKNKGAQPATTGSPQNTTPQPNQNQPQNQVHNEKVGKTTVGALEKTMSNEDRSLSGGAPGELEKGKTALANAIINNSELDHPAKVAPSTGTATTQDAQIMRDAYTNRANGGADPIQGRTQFGNSHNGHLKSRSAGNGLKGKAGRETVFAKFGPFKDSISRRPTYIYIYNDPGH